MLRGWDYRWSASLGADVARGVLGRGARPPRRRRGAHAPACRGRLHGEQRDRRAAAAGARRGVRQAHGRLRQAGRRRGATSTASSASPATSCSRSTTRRRAFRSAFTSSRWGSLASFGARAYPGTKKWYGTSGNSFVAVVEFGDSVRAQAVTAGGESGDPQVAALQRSGRALRDRQPARRVLLPESQLKGHTERAVPSGQLRHARTRHSRTLDEDEPRDHIDIPFHVARRAAGDGRLSSAAAAQSADPSASMHWREIGPTRAGRARALSGVPSQPNVFYIGFDNGGVWRSTDYGSNWEPLFDDEPTGSIGAIAVAPSDPNIIYVGTGAGIIRPDLAVGDGVYKSTDAGKTWTHLGLRDSQMIAMIDVDPQESRTGSSSRRSAIRTGRTRSAASSARPTAARRSRKCSSRTSTRAATTCASIRAIRTSSTRRSGSSSRASSKGGASAAPATASSSRPTAARRGSRSPKDCRAVIQANIAIAPSNPQRAVRDGRGRQPAGGGAAAAAADARRASSASTSRPTPASTGSSRRRPRQRRPAAAAGSAAARRASAAATCRRSPSIRRTRTSSTAASTVFWRTEDGGVTWSAVRGAPGGDDYQKIVGQPEQSEHPARRRRSGRRRVGQSRRCRGATGTRSRRRRCITSPPTTRFRIASAAASRTPGSACVDSRSMDGEITFHDWHPVNIQEYGVAAPDPKNPDLVYGSQRTNVSLYNRKTGQTTHVGPSAEARGTEFNRNVRTMPINWSPVDPNVLFYASNVVWKIDRSRAQLDAHQPRPRAPDVGRAGERRQVREHGDAGAAGHDHRALAVAARHQGALGRHRRRQHPGDDRTAARSGRTSRRRRSSRGRASSTSTPATSTRRRRTPRRTRCASTT